MCLLHSVVGWDSQRVQCRAQSHRSLDNPLRSRDQLSAACGIEYAAQAMAVHSALVALPGNGQPLAGFLVSVRRAALHVLRLDDIDTDLDIEAVCIGGSDEQILYQFSVHTAGRLLLDGRAAVVVNANSMMSTSPSGDTS